MHQRSCRVIHGLNDELLTDLEQQSTENSTDSFNSSTVEENDAMETTQVIRISQC